MPQPKTAADATATGGVWALWQWVVVRPPWSLVLPFLVATSGPIGACLIPELPPPISMTPATAALVWSAFWTPVTMLFVWARLLKDYAPTAAFGQLRVADDGRSVWLGIGGALITWSVAVWAAALPAFALVFPQPRVLTAVWLVGLAAVLVSFALQQALGMVSMRYPLAGTVLGMAYGLVYAFAFGRFALPLIVGLNVFMSDLSASPAPLAIAAPWFLGGVALTAAVQAWAGWFFSNVEPDEFGFRTKEENQKRLKAAFAFTKRAKRTSRPSHRWGTGWWAGRPLVERAFRETIRSGFGTVALITATVASALVVAIQLFGDALPFDSFVAWVIAMQVTQVAVGVTIFRLAVGPWVNLSRERTGQTLGLLSLTHGLKTTVRQVTVGILLAIAVAVSPLAVGAVALFWEPAAEFWMIVGGVLIPPAIGLMLFVASWSFYWIALPASEADGPGTSPRQWLHAAGEAGIPKWMLASVVFPPLLLAGPYYAWKHLSARETGG